MPKRLEGSPRCYSHPVMGEGMKTAYERALERMERDGIERPSAANLSAETRARIADVKSRAEAQLAELEILNRRELAGVSGEEREKLERNYWRERQRIEAERDRKIEALRGGD